jgi:DNA polymerase-3 subunit alpha
MGKKNFEVMRAQQEQFMAGALQRGVSEREAEQIWEMMLQFAGYGFNKAHAVCYAWIAYQTAYLKAHYPSFFMCAMLNSYMGNSSKLAEILAQCRRMNITVLPPSVQEGQADFAPTADGKIIFGLCGIKGIGGGAVEAIIKQREAGGQFDDLADFYTRLKGQGINKKVLQALSTAGAFDSIDPDRRKLIANIDNIELLFEDTRQLGLFGLEEGPSASNVIPGDRVTDYDVALREKEAIGLFLTNHPYSNHPMFADPIFWQLARLRGEVEHEPQRWADTPLPQCGLVGLLTNVMTRTAGTSGKTYAKGRLEDPEQSVAVVIWPRAYEQAKSAIFENSPVIVWGRVQVPEMADEDADSWDALELVIERVEPYPAERMALQHEPQAVYDAPLAVPESSVAHSGNGNGARNNETANGNGARHSAPVQWLIDLERCPLSDLEELASLLQHTDGEQEVRLSLMDVSGQLRDIERSFFTSADALSEMRSRFEFLRQA